MTGVAKASSASTPAAARKRMADSTVPGGYSGGQKVEALGSRSGEQPLVEG